MGTAIAWFVVIGDVSPAVVSSLLGIEVRSYSFQVKLLTKTYQLIVFFLISRKHGD